MLTGEQCVCRHDKAIDEIFQLLEDINTTLPLYNRASAVYPDAESLRWVVRDLFENYMRACLAIVKFVTRASWSMSSAKRAFGSTNVE